MVDNWNITSFAYYMNSLLKRYFAQENLISSGAVELRAAWRTAQYVYCVFSGLLLGGLYFQVCTFSIFGSVLLGCVRKQRRSPSPLSGCSKGDGLGVLSCCCCLVSAVSYSPTTSRLQYHQR